MTATSGGNSPAQAPRTETDSDQSSDIPEFPPTPDTLVYAYGREPTAEEKAAHDLQAAAVKIVRAHAEALANGDPVRAGIFERSMWYEHRMEPEPPMRRNGGMWWLVGRNASHQFYLGYNAHGELCRGAYGEDTLREGDPDFKMEMWALHKEVDSRHRRRHGDEGLGVRGDAWMEAENGRLRRCYIGDVFSWSRIEDPKNLGYLGHG